MLSNAEETLTDTDKASAIGASSNPNATSLPITAHNNDQQLGEGMESESRRRSGRSLEGEKNEGARAAEKIKKGARRRDSFFGTPAERAAGCWRTRIYARGSHTQGACLRDSERLTVLAWQDLGRGLLLSGEPAPTREVPDCPPPSRRASQGPGLARTSPVWLPATERRFVHSALNPCCCYVVSTPDIYPTTITSSQGRNQPTASWSPSTAT
ncbi:hypothetical protein MRX96_017774 [Rhipicephalus microplus]